MSSQCFLSKDCRGSLMKPCCQKRSWFGMGDGDFVALELSNLYRTIIQRIKMQYMVEGSSGVNVEW